MAHTHESRHPACGDCGRPLTTEHRCGCAYCDGTVPYAIRIAFYDASREGDPVLGDFCSVVHALLALAEAMSRGELTTCGRIVLGLEADRTRANPEELARVVEEARAYSAEQLEPPERPSETASGLFSQRPHDELN